MNFNPISISGYHMREAGSTAAQEVGFTIANGLEYVRHAVAAGVDLARFGPRLSFFFAAITTSSRSGEVPRRTAPLARAGPGPFGPTTRPAGSGSTQTGGVTLQARSR